jgi:hypothetical protein
LQWSGQLILAGPRLASAQRIVVLAIFRVGAIIALLSAAGRYLA